MGAGLLCVRATAEGAGGAATMGRIMHDDKDDDDEVLALLLDDETRLRC